jgi:hypothetical protein
LELLSIAHHEMHRAAMAVDAIAQSRRGENLKALGPARNNHPSPPPSVRFLSEGIGKEATNLMQDGFSSSGWQRVPLFAQLPRPEAVGESRLRR